MIALSVAKLKMLLPESENFLWIKPKKKLFVESLDQCRRLQVREKARNAFCDEPTSVWPQGATQHRIYGVPLRSKCPDIECYSKSQKLVEMYKIWRRKLQLIDPDQNKSKSSSSFFDEIICNEIFDGKIQSKSKNFHDVTN